MEGKIKEIYEKYGDLVFSLAVPSLLDCGRANFQRIDVDVEARNLLAQLDGADDKDGRVPLVSNELRVETFRCAAELAHVDALDILKYIQTGMRLRGVNVHPGNIISFKDRKTGLVCSELVLNKELSASDKDRLADKVRGKIAGNGRSPKDAIAETLDEMGISWDYIYSDKEIVF